VRLEVVLQQTYRNFSKTQSTCGSYSRQSFPSGFRVRAGQLKYWPSAVVSLFVIYFPGRILSFALRLKADLLSVFYLQLYAVEHGIDETLAFYSVGTNYGESKDCFRVLLQIAILNGVGIVGRVGSTWLADQYGIWNVQTPLTLGTAVMIWAILGTYACVCVFLASPLLTTLYFSRNPATLIVVSCLYGTFSSACT
jgi:hypothetical protein